MKTLILGLGNPLMRDDGAGLIVARCLYERLADGETDLVEAAIAGLQTIPLLAGYDRAIVIDAICNGRSVGDVYRFEGEDLHGHPCQVTHGTGLASALEWARGARFEMPRQVTVFAIAVADADTFGESLTPEVEKAIPAAVDMIAEDLGLH